MPPVNNQPVAGTTAAAAGSSIDSSSTQHAVIPSSPATSLPSSFSLYNPLLAAVADGWSGTAQLDEFRRTIMHHLPVIAKVQEEPPLASARAAIESRNVEVDGIKLNLSDSRTVQYVLDVSSALQLNEYDALRLVYSSAQALSAEDSELVRSGRSIVQDVLRTRCVATFFKRRFNLLSASIDLLLMAREAGGGSDGSSNRDAAQAHVVRECVRELFRMGMVRSTIQSIESLQNAMEKAKKDEATAAAAATSTTQSKPTAATAQKDTTTANSAAALAAKFPQLSTYRAQELRFLYRLLFALVRVDGGVVSNMTVGVGVGLGLGSSQPSHSAALNEGIQNEDITRLVELLQSSSGALHGLPLSNGGSTGTNQGGGGTAAAASSFLAQAQAAASSHTPDSAAVFHCYVLLLAFAECLESKYQALSILSASSSSSALESDMTLGGGPANHTAYYPNLNSSSAAAEAAAANALQDLDQFIRLFTRKLTSPDNWSSDVLRAGCYLIWALFLKRIKTVYPGGMIGAELSDDEVQAMVLEGLGGAEAEGFFIHLHATIASNPNWIGVRTNVSEDGSGGSMADGSGDSAAHTMSGLTSPSAADMARSLGVEGASTSLFAAFAFPTHYLSSTPDLVSLHQTSIQLVAEWMESLSILLHAFLTQHARELEMLRREEKRTEYTWRKNRIRTIQQAKQQAQYQLQGYAGSSGQVGASHQQHHHGLDLSPPPPLNFGSLLFLLRCCVKSCPCFVELLWNSSECITFMGVELGAGTGAGAATGGLADSNTAAAGGGLGGLSGPLSPAHAASSTGASTASPTTPIITGATSPTDFGGMGMGIGVGVDGGLDSSGIGFGFGAFGSGGMMMGSPTSSSGSGSLLSASNPDGSSFHTASTSSQSIFTSDSPFLMGYLDLLAACCVDALASMRIFQFLRRANRGNWEMICVNFLQQKVATAATASSSAAAASKASKQARQAADQHASMMRGVGVGSGRGSYGGYRGPFSPATPIPSSSSTSTSNAPLSPRHVALLRSLLRLLSSVVSSNPTLQTLFVGSDFKLLETCFALLGVAGLDVNIKADLIQLIRSLAYLNQQVANQVWERMERSQMLPTRFVGMMHNVVGTATTAAGGMRQGVTYGFGGIPTSSSSVTSLPTLPIEGLLYDLEEVENARQKYVLTTSFLHLLATLLHSAPMPTQLGMGTRGLAGDGHGVVGGGMGVGGSAYGDGRFSSGIPSSEPTLGLAPYLSFVSSHVFLNLPHRFYARAEDRFKLNEACLSIFNSFIEEFIEEVQAAEEGVRFHATSGGSGSGAGAGAGPSNSSGVSGGGAIGGAFEARHMWNDLSNPHGKATRDSNVDGDASGGVNASLYALASHPAIGLLRDILQGKELLHVLLMHTNMAFACLQGAENSTSQATTGSGGVDPNIDQTLHSLSMHPSVEGTLMLSCRLIWSVLEKEDQILRVLQRIDDLVDDGRDGSNLRALRAATPFTAGLHGRYTRLSHLLLQHQSTVLTLAQAVGYIQTRSPSPMLRLVYDKERQRRRAHSAASTSAPSSGSGINGSTLDQSSLLHTSSMYEGEEQEMADESFAMLGANASNVSAPNAADINADTAHQTEAAFYAASVLLLLSQRDDARLVHIFEANNATGRVIDAFQKQLANIQLPVVGTVALDDRANDVEGINVDGDGIAVTASSVRDPDLVCNRTRLLLLDILLSSLSVANPTTPHLCLALLLLGFDTTSAHTLTGSDLRHLRGRLSHDIEDGAIGADRFPGSSSGGVSLVEALFGELATKNNFATTFPSFAQNVFQLLYRLLAHPLTNAPMLRWMHHQAAEGAARLRATDDEARASGFGSPSAAAGTPPPTVTGYLCGLLRALPIVSDHQRLLLAMQQAKRRAPNQSSSPLMLDSSLSSGMYHSLTQVSWILRCINLHYFQLISALHSGDVDCSMDGAGGIGIGIGAWEQGGAEAELEEYWTQLGFMHGGGGASSSDGSGATSEEHAYEQEEDERVQREQQASENWLANVSTSNGGGGHMISKDPNEPTAAASGGSALRGMRLLDILAHMHALLSAALPPNFQLDPPSSIIGNGATGFDVASTKYFDTQHQAYQYSLRDVYIRALLSGLSSADAYVECRKCLHWNVVSSVLGCVKQAFESWKSTMAVVWNTSTQELSGRGAQRRSETVLVQTITTLLKKLVPIEGGVAGISSGGGDALSIWVALGQQISGLCLVLIAKLRQLLHMACMNDTSRMGGGIGGASSLLSFSSSISGSRRLHTILQLLVGAVLSTRQSATRTNLYAVLLHYLLYARERSMHIEASIARAQKEMEASEGGAGTPAGIQSLQRRWITIQMEEVELDRRNLSLLSAHNLPLLTQVVNDALDGSTRLRGLAFRFLNLALLGVNGRGIRGGELERSYAASSSAAEKDGKRGRVRARSSSSASRYFSANDEGYDDERMDGGEGAFGSASTASAYTSNCLSIFAQHNLLLLFLNQLKSNDSTLHAAIHASTTRTSGISSSSSAARAQFESLLHLDCLLSFLVQLSLTPQGARMLVEHQVVRILSSMRSLSDRPAPSASVGVGGGLGDIDDGKNVGSGGSVRASTFPTPFARFQSLYLLVLQLLVALLTALPNHAGLLDQLHTFLASEHHDVLLTILRDAPTAAPVTPTGLQALSTTISLVYRAVRAEKAQATRAGGGIDAGSMMDKSYHQQQQQQQPDHLRKLQKLLGGGRGAAPSLRQVGSGIYEQSSSFNGSNGPAGAGSAHAAPLNFRAFFARHQSMFLRLLARYFHPFASATRLRNYLKGLAREIQERLVVMGEEGIVVGGALEDGLQSAPFTDGDGGGDFTTEHTPLLPTTPSQLLEQGDGSMQGILRKVLALLVSTQMGESSGGGGAADVSDNMGGSEESSTGGGRVLFGPHMGDGISDSASVAGRWGDDGADESGPPQLELLLALIDVQVQRLQTAKRSLVTLRNNQLQLKQSMDASSSLTNDSSSSSFSVSGGTFSRKAAGATSASSTSSLLASLELEFFPPSSSAAFYDMDPTHKLQALLTRMHGAETQARRNKELAMWNLEHALMLLSHHVRIYLPSSPSISASGSGRGSNGMHGSYGSYESSAHVGRHSSGEFRSKAESIIVPLIDFILAAVTPPRPHGSSSGRNQEQQSLTLYQPELAAVQAPRLASALDAQPHVFIVTIGNRIKKIITG